MRSFPESNIGQPPRIGITMGDPAGIGAEIIVKALAHDQIYEICRPLVIGDAARLRKAIEIVGLPTEVNSISDPDDGAYRLGQIDCLDLGLVQSDLPFGIKSAAAGEAAFRYVERAAALALSGAIDAICTAPLSKEAMHAAGHRFPGHTELLASLTGTHEVSMMLVAPPASSIRASGCAESTLMPARTVFLGEAKKNIKFFRPSKTAKDGD
jgi:4-hydroxy-L-threonine phosphate dehydrogenase PdxA